MNAPQEENTEPVQTDFQDHLFSETNTHQWKTIDTQNLINDNFNNIYEVMARIKATSINLPPGMNNYSSIKKFMEKMRMSKRVAGQKLNFKNVFGLQIPGLSDKKPPSKSKLRINFTLKEKTFSPNHPFKTLRLNTDFTLGNTSPLKSQLSKDTSFENSIDCYNNKYNSNRKSKTIVPKFNFNSLPSHTARQSGDFSKKLSQILPNPDKFDPKAAPKSFRDIKKEYNEQFRLITETVCDSPIKVKSTTRSHKTLLEPDITDKAMEHKLRQGYTDRDVKLQREKLNRYDNPDYTEEEMKRIKKELKPKGVFIVDNKNKKKYLTIEKECIHVKDYYINTITESSALTYKKLLSQRYLVNSQRNFGIEKLEKIINSKSLKDIGKRQEEINRINSKMRGNFYNILRK
jgi:hypothetical protein